MASLERFALAPDLTICRILNGMWQVSGAHGRIEREKALESMAAHIEAGFTTWDLADHYGPAEDFVGEFRRRYAAERGKPALAQKIIDSSIGAIQPTRRPFPTPCAPSAKATPAPAWFIIRQQSPRGTTLKSSASRRAST